MTINRTFFVEFIASGSGKTGLSDVTVTVWKVTRASPPVATALAGGSVSAVVEVGNGKYAATALNIDPSTYDYLANFQTADSTVTQKDVGAVLPLLPADLYAYASGQDPATLVLDVAASGHNTSGTIGAKINAAGGAADPLTNAVPGSYASGTAGAALGRIGTGEIVAVSPVSADGGTLTLYIGDDYYSADAAALEWTQGTATWPDLTGATVQLCVGDGLMNVTGTVVTPTGSSKRVRFEPTHTDTAKLAPSHYTFQVKATLSGGHVRTLVEGACIAKDSQAS